MLVRYNNPDGSHGYEDIDFRETMPKAGMLKAYSDSVVTNGSFQQETSLCTRRKLHSTRRQALN